MEHLLTPESSRCGESHREWRLVMRTNWRKVSPVDVCWLLVDGGSPFSPETTPWSPWKIIQMGTLLRVRGSSFSDDTREIGINCTVLGQVGHRVTLPTCFLASGGCSKVQTTNELWVLCGPRFPHLWSSVRFSYVFISSTTQQTDNKAAQGAGIVSGLGEPTVAWDLSHLQGHRHIEGDGTIQGSCSVLHLTFNPQSTSREQSRRAFF